VFQRSHGYAWSIAGGGGAVQWGPTTYTSEIEAVCGLLCELERLGQAEGVDLLGLPRPQVLDYLPEP
jgi:hypothetical protein